MQVLRLVLHFPFTPFRVSVVLAQDDQQCWFRTKLHGHPEHKTEPVILSEVAAATESKDLHLLLCDSGAIICAFRTTSMHDRYYYTYIVASRSLTLYIGMTGDLDKRIFEHKNKFFEGFSADYNCNRLVWFERYAHASSAIAREKQLKGWTRAKKLALIKKSNPTWVDLSEAWYTPEQLVGAIS